MTIVGSCSKDLSQSLQFLFNGRWGVSNIPHGFGETLFRHVEFVSPVLHFVGFLKTDPAAVVRTPVGEIVRHDFLQLFWSTQSRPTEFQTSLMTAARGALRI